MYPQSERFGERLANGAIIIASKQIEDSTHQIVLARSTSGAYVTWTEYRHAGEQPATGSGHYFASIAEAAADFERR